MNVSERLRAYLVEARQTLMDCDMADEPVVKLAIEVGAAVGLVLELHAPKPLRWADGTGPVVVCRECSPITYPCATVRAVSESLGVR